MAEAPPSDTEVMRALADVMGSGVFGANSRQPRLLRYLVQTELEGRGDRLKAYAIGTEALGRGDGFDPATDSIVRVEVNRLRQSLAHYYATEGADARVVIEVPKGQYRPVFRTVTPEAVVGGVTSGVTTPRHARHPAGFRARRYWAFAAAGIAGLAVAVTAIVLLTGGTREDAGPAEPAPTSQSAAAAFAPAIPTDPSADRPAFPRIFTRSSSDAPAVDLIMLAVQNVASRFDGVRVLTQSPSTGQGRPWPEDYMIEVTALPGEEGVGIFLRLVHLLSGELVDSREVRVSGLELDALDLENRLAVQRETARFVDIGGALGQDYRRRGDYTPTMRCALFLQDYFAAHSHDSLTSARLCAEAEIGGGNREPFLYTALSFLRLDDWSLHGDAASDGERQSALRAAQSAVNRDPTSAMAHLAQMLALSMIGDVEGAQRSGNRAVELNPFSGEIVGIVGLQFCHLERFDRGLELLERSAELEGRTEPWREFGLFLAHYGLGDRARAAGHARALAESTDPYFLAGAVMAAQIEGDGRRATMLAGRLLALEPAFAADPRAAFKRRRLPPVLVDDFVASLDAATTAVRDGADQ